MSSAADRRFLTSTAYRKLRAYKLANDPVCEICEREGRITPATEVDHRLPREQRPDLAMSYKNLQSICFDCHVSKSKKENKQAIGLVSVLNRKYKIKID